MRIKIGTLFPSKHLKEASSFTSSDCGIVECRMTGRVIFCLHCEMQ